MAAVLHDVIEDTAVSREQVAERFGEEVAALVDGVSKLTQIRFKSKAEAQAANFRKMMLAMSRDVRVILIKLADRLHNMRTLDVMRPDKRRRIARETLEIYAPIATRLGINNLRYELEDLGFRAQYPWRYSVLERAVNQVRRNRRALLQEVKTKLRGRLAQAGIAARVEGREKRLLSLYRKMQNKHLSFRQVLDVFAVRIILPSVDDCYRALGLAHGLYKPLPGRFKDYIAIPKANGYQSLHTVLFGPNGAPIELQIRTDEMHRYAESGIASHWRYKGSSMPLITPVSQAWVNNLENLQAQSGNPQEFLEQVKADLFPDEVYVFTPMGEILSLPPGATALDFAFAVHTDLGHHARGCRIDRHPAPLSAPLRSGQTVEVLTAPDAQPLPQWLNFSVSAKARGHIRNWLKRLRFDEAATLGERLLRQAIKDLGGPAEDPLLCPDAALAPILADYQLEDRTALYRAIGLGERQPTLVAQHLLARPDGPERSESGPADPSRAQLLSIDGTEGLVVHFAKCCHPLPGDQIVGYANPGRGLVVHRSDCAQLPRARGPRWLELRFADQVRGDDFLAEFDCEVESQAGALALLAAEIAHAGIDIRDVKINQSERAHPVIRFTVAVTHLRALQALFRRLRRVAIVLSVQRV